MIDDYAYGGMDFMGDPELMLPPGTQWGPQGTKVSLEYKTYFLTFESYVLFWIYG